MHQKWTVLFGVNSCCKNVITTKIKRTNICVQYTLRVYNYCGLPQPQKYFNTKILHTKIFHTKFSQITVSA